jgi:hypothetical protein
MRPPSAERKWPSWLRVCRAALYPARWASQRVGRDRSPRSGLRWCGCRRRYAPSLATVLPPAIDALPGHTPSASIRHLPRAPTSLASLPNGLCGRLHASSLPHPHQDWAHPCHNCTGAGLTPATSATGTGLTAATSAPGLGSPLPQLHRDWAHRCHIRTGTGLTPSTSAPGLSSPLPQLHRD